ncbi:bleomycin hydrolase [Friedmanniomyces endolithicus]|uniref:Cysteine proteinase 1, mitochondrial n=1 Tax=Friedmanniomyces endolithicus TaxID=329885 RepID=A0AAN6FPU7_9PEZI|nr:bleomycin hydrolase [Friedmanniomyces endolithicus]KAK0285438.1 bleomycin hydrolase [Friedmanniomyces endolithicus]KAK0321468.1 bleomycin hydrolase [Friedmanniomyces endolithicus]KAK0986906.1 bleomycin hydrolase [Friedmanniomyces endolithicus]
MGNTESTHTPQQPPTRAGRRRQTSTSSPTQSLDEKFDAIRIDHHHSHNPPSSHNVLSTSDTEHVSGTQTIQYVRDLLKDNKNRLGLSALSTANPSSVLEIPSAILKDTQTFNLSIPHEGTPVTNQRSSGRCWIFAATNVFRIAIQQKYDIKNFELSQAYLFFWDKVEKANYFLTSLLDTAEEYDVDSRLVSALMASPVGDGGQWDMIVNLVAKYGIVPQTLYPDSWNAQNSSTMDRLLTTKLREDGLKLRAMRNDGASDEEIADTKEGMMQDVVRILTLCLGPPPAANEKFTWEYTTTKHQVKTASLTPLDFAASTEVKKFISFVNDPRNPYNRLLTVDHLGNVYDGRPITYVNVSAQTLKQACVAMLRKGLPIFFGSDVGKMSDSQKGIMDTALVDYDLGFDVQLGMSKAQRLLTGESQMTHAMVLTAVHLDKEGEPVRWRVENSWSVAAGTEGYFVMSDAWMDEFCYQAVVDPAVVSKEVRDVLSQEAKVLPLWDPMGALA